MARRLIGVGMVKNEADIIEAHVRHNLRCLDHLIVLDHASSDATLDILKALTSEGLPITMTRLPQASPAFNQAECITSLAHAAFAKHGADYVFPLDADEFLHCVSRETLERAIDEADSALMHMRWSTYIAAEAATEKHPLQRLRWRVETTQRKPPKVVVGRAAIHAQDWQVGPGNHVLYTDGKKNWSAGKPLRNIELAHLPLRSREQLIAKAVIGWLSSRLIYGAQANTTRFGWHWRELCQRIVAGDEITDADVRKYAIAIYALDRLPGGDDAAQFTLVEEPIAAPDALRYTPDRAVDPAHLLAAWSSLLVDRVLQMQSPA